MWFVKMKGVGVAPFTGAWIETPLIVFVIIDFPVAPFTGAWIETVMWFVKMKGVGVAPFTGAWIETHDDYLP